jgi:hypothetical protein
VIRRIAPHVAEDLRRAVTLGPLRAPAVTAAAAGAPGIILLDQDLALMSTAAFDKFGVRSRRELVAAMLTGHPG